MKNNPTITLLSNEAYNVSFILELNSTKAVFRISYADKTPRRNSRYKIYYAVDIYFEGWEALPKEPGYKMTAELSSMTDLCLFAERRKQWLLEHLTR